MPKMQIPLDSSNDHAMALGKLMGHFAILESQLQMVMATLLGIDQFRAAIVFQSFISLRAKVDMITRLSYVFLNDSPERAELIKLLDESGKANTIRNDHAHATWAAGDPGALTRISGSLPNNPKHRIKPFKAFTASDIQKDVETIATLSAKIQHFVIEKLLQMPISRQPLV
jgi:hypothetical protein